MDLIDRQAALDAIEFGITYAKKINKETGEVSELFQEGNAELRKAAERVNELPPVQPEEDTIEMQEADIDETMKRLRDARVTIPLSVQPEIVYCRDCKHWLHEHLCIELSKYGTIETLPNEFCSRAERRTENADVNT